MNELMTRADVARHLSISIRQVDRLDLPRHYIGRLPRYYKTDIDQFVDRKKVVPNKISIPNQNHPSMLKQNRQRKQTTPVCSTKDELRALIGYA